MVRLSLLLLLELQSVLGVSPPAQTVDIVRFDPLKNTAFTEALAQYDLSKISSKLRGGHCMSSCIQSQDCGGVSITLEDCSLASKETVWQNLTVADPDSTSYILIPRTQFSSTNLNIRTLNTFVPSGLHGECYKDNPSRLLPSQQQVGPVTMGKCYSRCASKGYKYAGLQNGSQCFCGSISPPTSALVSLSECSKPCQGDPGQKCGASWRMNVYLIKTN